MRSRGLILSFTLLALVAGSCSGSEPDQAAADRSVGETDPEWDAEHAILRTVLIEGGLEAGLGRTASGCMIDTTLAAGDFTLEDLDGVDFTAHTGSGAGRDLSAALADALIECGPSLREKLDADIPGALTIPATFAVEAECVTNAYVDAWRDVYTDRFRDRVITDEEPVAPDVKDRIVGIVAGCDAGGAVVLGASNDGNLDTFALSTLEWECLEARITPDEFTAAFPFPEEPGDALDRMGSGVLSDVTFCEAWVSGVADDATENFDEVDDAIS
jgi:hypothetical protein